MQSSNAAPATRATPDDSDDLVTVIIPAGPTWSEPWTQTPDMRDDTPRAADDDSDALKNFRLVEVRS